MGSNHLALIGPVTQPDYLDGELILVDGDEDRVVVHLRDEGTIHRCTANAHVARKLGPHLNRSYLRVFGTASWIRHEAGWELQRFFVEDFVPLDDKLLGGALSELEELPSEENRSG